MTKDLYTICLYHQGVEKALARFINYFWPSDSSRSHGALEFSDERHESHTQRRKDSPTIVALRNEDVIGHIASIPVQLSIRSATTAAHWMVGFMVLPEYRNGLIGPLLIKKVNEVISVAMSIHVEETVLRIMRGLGWQHVGIIPQYVRVLNGHGLIQNVQFSKLSFLNMRSRIMDSCLRLFASHLLVRHTVGYFLQLMIYMFALATTLVRRPHKGLIVNEEYEFNKSFDDFWNIVSPQFESLVVRDQAYLRARYGERLNNYTLLVHRRNGNLEGFCIIKVKHFNDDPRVRSLRIGTIVDCLFDPRNPEVLDALISDSVQRFLCQKVDVILCSASHHAVQNALVRNAFIKIPGSLNMAYYDRDGVIAQPPPLSSWHLMRGDSDADGNF